MKITIKPPSSAENNLIADIRLSNNLCIEMYKAFSRDNNELIDINYRSKNEGERKGEYGYFIGYNPGAIIYIMKELQLNSLLDLGSGAGVILKVINHYWHKFKHIKDISPRIAGYEIEDSLINIAQRMWVDTQKKNILTLTKEDIKNYKALYFWEPFIDPKMSKIFVDNLLKILTKDHVIIYHQSGQIGNFLKKSNKVDMVNFEVYQIITLK